MAEPALVAQPETVALVPAFNAEPSLGRVIESIHAQGLPVIVIDDGSTDLTRQVAESAGVLQVVFHEQNRGKGAALKTGFESAGDLGFSHVLTFDADGQHPADAIPAFLDAGLEDPDAILVGNRFSDHTIGEMPWVRRLSNGLSSRLISWAAGTSIPDAQCGMRLYPLWMLRGVELESDGYAMETEVLVKACRKGFEVVNIPISCQYPEGTATSRYRAFVDSYRIAKAVIRSLRENP